MTRRTPKPGDSYSKGLFEWRVIGQRGDGIEVERRYAGAPINVYGLTVAQFHEFVAIATWGRP
jgi:hypothetical protein